MQGKVKELTEKNAATGDGGNGIIFEEMRDRESRKDNILVYNIPEAESSIAEERGKQDRDEIYCLADSIKADMRENDIKFMTRLGKYEENKNRPILMAVRYSPLKDYLLNNAYKLKHGRYENVRITKDLTKRQRDEELQLIEEAKKRNSDLSEEEKKNFEWKVIGKKGERRLIKGQLRQETDRTGQEYQNNTQTRYRGRESHGARPNNLTMTNEVGTGGSNKQQGNGHGARHLSGRGGEGRRH